MKLAWPILIALVFATAALPVAWGTRRVSASRDRLETATTSLETAQGRAERVLALRANVERAATQKRPEQDLIARANAVLLRAGVPERSLGSVQGQADTVLSGGADGELEYRRQSVRLSLNQLTPPEVGRFLVEWNATQPLWTPAQINVQRDRTSRESARYNVTIVVSATYIGER